MKKAIVVGATSGIGAALARRLAADGYRVGITGRRTEMLEKLKSEAPESYITKSFDVTETEKAISSMEELIGELGGLDLIVLSSGIGFLNEDLDFDFEQQVIRVNVTGFTNLVNFTYRFFEKQNSGHLVAITSIAGLRGSARAAVYHASKAYQSNYVEALQQRITKRKQQVRITNVRPGFVDTALIDGLDMFWKQPLDKAANQIYKAIKARRREVFVTRRWNLLALGMKLTPAFIYDRLKIS